MPAHVSGRATLVDDPRQGRWGAVEAEAVVSGRHFRLQAKGKQAAELRPMLAGQHLLVEGTAQRVKGKAAGSLRRRHIAGQIQVESISLMDKGSTASRTANGLRQLLGSGAASMSLDERSLFTGLVIGDDREQSAEMTSDFRDAGLLHLLAVSGHNVAFVLIVMAPLLRRFALSGRFLGAVITLAFFGAVTRWEPSVMRAEAMAAVALTAVYLGRPISLLRTIALAVTASLLVDPFLVGSIGFLLSVGACIGMACLGEKLSNSLIGPALLTRSLGYSAAAQLGVAPVQLAVFGPVPIAGLIANLLAGPVAGLVMMWGLVAGVIAGIVGEPMATWLHAPTSLMVRWIAAVAHVTAKWHLGGWGKESLWWGISVLAISIWWRKRPTRIGSPDAKQLSGQEASVGE